MLYFYTYGFHSSLNCDAFMRLKRGLGISPIQLEYDNGGLFMDNIMWLKEQILGHLSSLDSKKSQNIESKLITPSHTKNLNKIIESKNLQNLDSTKITESKSKNPKFCFIGNSQGAFYLSQLATFSTLDSTFPKPFALFLFNPVVDSIFQLKKYIGDNVNTTTNTHFDFTKKALDSYKSAINHAGNLSDNIKRYVFIALQDELINPQDSIHYFEKTSKIITFNSTHKIYDFSIFADILREFEREFDI